MEDKWPSLNTNTNSPRLWSIIELIMRGNICDPMYYLYMYWPPPGCGVWGPQSPGGRSAAPWSRAVMEGPHVVWLQTWTFWTWFESSLRLKKDKIQKSISVKTCSFSGKTFFRIKCHDKCLFIFHQLKSNIELFNFSIKLFNMTSFHMMQ